MLVFTVSKIGIRNTVLMWCLVFWPNLQSKNLWLISFYHFLACKRRRKVFNASSSVRATESKPCLFQGKIWCRCSSLFFRRSLLIEPLICILTTSLLPFRKRGNILKRPSSVILEIHSRILLLLWTIRFRNIFYQTR